MHFFFQVNDVLKCRKAFEYLAKESLFFKDQNWKKIEEVHKILDVFFQSSKRMQRADMKMSDFYAEWLFCKIHLQKLNAAPHFTNLVQNLQLTMSNRQKMLFDNKAILCCTFLDPRFNKDLKPTEVSAARSFITEWSLKMAADARRSGPLSLDLEGEADVATASSSNAGGNEKLSFADELESYFNDKGFDGSSDVNGEASNGGVYDEVTSLTH